jgi:hypothetical protein
MWFTFFGMAVTIIFSLIISVIVNLINKCRVDRTANHGTDSTAEIRTSTETSRRSSVPSLPASMRHTSTISATATTLTTHGGYENGGFENKLEKHKTNGSLSSYRMKNEINNEKSSVYLL